MINTFSENCCQSTKKYVTFIYYTHDCFLSNDPGPIWGFDWEEREILFLDKIQISTPLIQKYIYFIEHILFLMLLSDVLEFFLSQEISFFVEKKSGFTTSCTCINPSQKEFSMRNLSFSVPASCIRDKERLLLSAYREASGQLYCSKLLHIAINYSFTYPYCTCISFPDPVLCSERFLTSSRSLGQNIINLVKAQI